MRRNVLLVLPSYFTPWTPPLGISILKSYLERRGHTVRCVDFNTRPQLWGMHHRYFAKLRELEGVSINDGYSKLWYVLNAHLLSQVNGAPPAVRRQVIRTVAPLYDIRTREEVIDELIAIVDRYFEDLREVVDGLDVGRFDVVGTSTYTTSLSTALFLLREAKRRHPGATTVMGGGIFADDLALGSDNLQTLIDGYPFVDHIVLGEGEMLFGKLIDGELAHQRVISIADVQGKTLPINEVPEPDFSDFDLDSYYHLTIEGGRSCPFQCSFCSETTQWGDYRVKARDLLATQLDGLARRYGNNTFFMGDSLMNPYIQGLARELSSRGTGVLYDGYLRADKVAADRGRAIAWEDSGVYRVRLGIESASADVLKSMVKMTTPEIIGRALQALANAGIRTTTYWIVGFSGETEKNFQETLDFIREHHRYIYELEAHPYYYYPYGQVGSRLHSCYSLYPPEVTEWTRFKIWEVVDADPPRSEKYDRLRRISALGSELGLPNIYTMSDRYYAEERWQRLHPRAREVYKATHVHRRPVALPAAPVATPALSGAPVAALWIRLEEALDEAVLAAALERLHEHNEMLRVEHRDGFYRPAETPAGTRVLRVLPAPAGEADLRRLAGELAAELRPSPGDSLRLGWVPKGEEEQPGALLLLAHSAVTDPRGLCYLAEDLFRLYRQLADGRPVTLQPVGRTFLEDQLAGAASAERAVLHEGLSVARRIRGAVDGAAPAGFAVAREGAGAAVLAMRPGTYHRLFSPALTASGLAPGEALAAALAMVAGGVVPVDVTVDRRSADPELARAVGPFVAIQPLALPGVAVESAPSPEWIRKALRTAVPPREAGAGRVLLSCEVFVEEPWVEEDLWQAAGFVPAGSGPRAPYELELTPALRGAGLEIRAACKGEETPLGSVEELAARLAAALDRVLERCERHAAALEHCRRELSGVRLAPNFAHLLGGGRGEAWRERPLAIDGGAVDRLAAVAGAGRGDVVRAAFGVLVSRLSGREDVLLLAAERAAGDEAGWIAPLRLLPAWEAPFAELLRQAGAGARRSAPAGTTPLEILAGIGPSGSPWPRIDAGIGWFATAEGSLRDSLPEDSRLREGLDLSLDLWPQEGGTWSGRVQYRGGPVTEDLATAVAAHLPALVAALAADPGAALGEIGLGESRAAASRTLAEESFQF